MQKKFLMPSSGEYLGEETFSDVYLAWDNEGVSIFVNVKNSVESVDFVDFRKGDSVELFFDTRDLKTKSFITKFCHHFVFFPQSSKGNYAKEVTRFHGDDMHKICDPQDFSVSVEIKKSSYTMDIHIPMHCLHGLDVLRFDRMGFTYRINRYKKEPQNFSVSSKEYTIERVPFFWGSIKLIS